MKAETSTQINSGENQIVVYQPDETIRLDVRLENETVWLTQEQMSLLFGRTQPVIARHIGNIFREGELDREVVYAKFAYTTRHGAIAGKTQIKEVGLYNLDVVISVGYRVKSVQGTRFRQWATKVLKEFMLRGYAFNQRLNQLEDRIDRRMAKTEADVAELKDKVDFFVQTSMPPVQGVFYNDQVFDASVFAARHILSAKKSIFLIDSWVDVVTLELLAKKTKGVTVEIITSHRGNRISASDIAKFNAQHGGLSVRLSKNFHDRFLIIDDKTLYLVGASLKDLGSKCFAFAKLDASSIPLLMARV
ncbi:MAG: virulence RhuM family protein [Kiritimatiellae bacterium]|nr:virulence RhuM family protein [Kiritimatiellia bacterium]